MRLLFVADPLEKLDPSHDSTVAMIEAAQAAGHEVWVAENRQLGFGDRGPDVDARPVHVVPCQLVDGTWHTPADWLELGPNEQIRLSDFSAISMRTDPPVDDDYLRATHLLDLVDPAQTLVVNRPSGLRNANEKLFGLRHADLMPRTLISADKQRIREFVATVGDVIAKPTDGMGGRGIMKLNPADSNFASIIDLLTVAGKSQIVVQEFVPEVSQGDRRVIVINGSAVGAVARLAEGEDFRCNMAAGASSHAAQVDDTITDIVNQLKFTLDSEGLWFVGLDVIGNRLTEINVTSPTGIREIQALSSIDPAARYIEFLEQQT